MKSTILSLSITILTATTAAQHNSARTHKEPLGDGTLRELHTRDIRPLLTLLRSAAHRAIEPAAKVEDKNESARRINRRLAQMITEFVAPPFTSDEEIRAIGHTHLVAIARPEQHAWIEQFLEHQRTAVGHMVQLDVKVVQLDAQTYADLELDGANAILDKAELQKLMTAIRNHEKGVQWLTSPKLVARGLQEFTIAVTDQRAYVKDFDVQVANGTVIADPVVDVIESGIAMNGTAIAIDDEHLGLVGKIDISHADLPFPVKELAIGPGDQKVEIQTPHVHHLDTDTDIAMPAGTTALFRVAPSRGQHIVVFVTAHRLVVGRPDDDGKNRR